VSEVLTSDELLTLDTPVGQARQLALLRYEWRELRESLLAITPQQVMKPELHDSWQERIRGAQPLAGASYIMPVPGEYRVEPLAVTFRLTTSAAVAQRQAAIEWQDSDGIAYCVAGTAVAVSESDAKRFCGHAAAATGAWPVDDVAVFGFPALLMFPSDQLVIRVAAMDALDQIDQVRVSARYYSTRARDLPLSDAAPD
jgi:hypothetical protein